MSIAASDNRALPGGDLVERGLADLAQSRLGVEALLVLIGAPRLRRAGLDVPEGPMTDADRALADDPERALYEELARRHGDAAHGRYNALIRRLVSFERALECASR